MQQIVLNWLKRLFLPCFLLPIQSLWFTSWIIPWNSTPLIKTGLSANKKLGSHSNIPILFVLELSHWLQQLNLQQSLWEIHVLSGKQWSVTITGSTISYGAKQRFSDSVIHHRGLRYVLNMMHSRCILSQCFFHPFHEPTKNSGHKGTSLYFRKTSEFVWSFGIN